MTDAPEVERPAVSFRRVHKRFGNLEVLKGVDLDVGKGEVAVICGASGSGKSTLIRLVNGLETISDGEILVDGIPVSNLRGRKLQALRLRIGFVFQQFNLYLNLTAEENVTLALRKLRRIPMAEATERAMALLLRVGVFEKRHARPAELSGGQQQRVAIARALAMEPEIILFDEPTSALDPAMIGEVLAVMRELAHTGITMMVVTHEMGFARELADRIVFLHEGRVALSAPPSEFFGTGIQDPRILHFLNQVREPAEPAVENA